MTSSNETVVAQTANDTKELNFRKQQAMYERMLEEKEVRIAELQQKQQQQLHVEEDDNDDSPFVDYKKLDKKLNKFGQQHRQETQTDIQRAVQSALSDERKQNWLKNNPDFYETLQHAERFAAHDPELAETILQMPEGFERQKLVYRSIKSSGIDKPVKQEQSVQQKIDANRKSPYYQPTGVGTAPYASVGDFSATGQKQAHAKMQELKARLRI
jgi:hypothetical protein